jgi:hypothetical protein
MTEAYVAVISSGRARNVPTMQALGAPGLRDRALLRPFNGGPAVRYGFQVLPVFVTGLYCGG